MLSVTTNAADLIAQVVGQAQLPESAGLRISSNTPDDGPAPTGYTAEIVAGPHPLDQEVPGGAAHVYVEAEAAPELDDAVLDAAVDGDEVAFVLGRSAAS